MLSALLILLLAVSHAPMSAAMPHLDGSGDHAVMAQHGHAHLADHEAAQADADLEQIIESKSAPSKAPATAGHNHHVVADALVILSIDFAALRSANKRQLPPNDAALLPALLDSISEPPIA